MSWGQSRQTPPASVDPYVMDVWVPGKASVMADSSSGVVEDVPVSQYRKHDKS
jgi:hypothetical protein